MKSETLLKRLYGDDISVQQTNDKNNYNILFKGRNTGCSFCSTRGVSEKTLNRLDEIIELKNTYSIAYLEKHWFKRITAIEIFEDVESLIVRLNELLKEGVTIKDVR